MIFTQRHDVRFGYRSDLGPVLAAVADRHFRGTFLGEEPGAAGAHARDEQLQLLQIRVEDGEAACVCYCRGDGVAARIYVARRRWRGGDIDTARRRRDHRKSKAWDAAAMPSKT